jgi:ATP-binding cassette, subfamily B, bacterial PglK
VNLYATILKSLRYNLTDKEISMGGWIILLMILNAILDFFSVAVFIPVLAAVIDPNFIAKNSIVKNIFFAAGSPSHATVVIAITSGVLIFILLKNMVSFWIANIKASFAFKIRNDLAARAMEKYLGQNFIEFSRTDFTRELNTITSHPLAFANNIILSIATIISEGFVGIFILSCIAVYDYKLLVLVMVLLAPLFLIFRIRRKSLMKISQDLQTAYPKVLKYSNQVIEGFVEIKVYQKAVYFLDRFRKISKHLSDAFIRDHNLQAASMRLAEIIIAVVLCSLVIYSSAVEMAYHETLVLLGIYTAASFRIVPSVNRILHAMQQIRTNEFLLYELKIPASKASKNDIVSAPITFENTIAFRNISYKYPNGAPALKDVSLTIHRGEKIAITGGSGEGKTTLLLILLGFVEPVSGQFLIDGAPLLKKNRWQASIGYVPQNPYILDGTIAENIAFGVPPGDLDRKRVIELITDLGLRDLLQTLTNGIDTRIGEKGAQLSGGQRQRISIARALYANPEILVLDEVTNQVHDLMELEILNILDKLANDKKTIIMVTHKIKESAFFNSIYKLENGVLHQTTVHK